MKELASLLLNLVGYSVVMETHILVMVKGWGLQPKSWFWIIVMYTLGFIIAAMFTEVAKKVKED